MEANKVWHVSSNNYMLQDITNTEKQLDNAIYELNLGMMGFYLTRIGEKFEFDYKIYGLESPFIDKVLKTYAATKNNLGVLLNGIKGTGKSVTAKILANKFELPVILVTKQFSGMNSFLTSIQQDVVVFIDEYEKIFKGKMDYDDDDNEKPKGDSSLLSLMDGALTGHRKTFLLTTNERWVNENMLNRPGRIRYLKQFGDLTLTQLNEIMDDCLTHEHWREEIIAFIKPLKIITVDIVKAIISEVNIFDEDPADCCKDFNVEFKDDSFNIIQINPHGDDLIYKEDVNAVYVKTFMARAKTSPKTASLSTGDMYLRCISAEDDIYTVRNDYATDTQEQFHIRFEKVRARHSIFAY